MKNSLRGMIALVAVIFAFSCMYIVQAQGKRPPMVGGYKVIATDDPEAQKAADFAVDEQKKNQDGPLSLVSIEHAERQVVAGTNYRLCLKVKAADETDAGEETQDVKVVVYRNLKGEYSLTSWEEADCSEGN